MKPSVRGFLTDGSSALLEPGVKCLLKKSFLSVQNPHPTTKNGTVNLRPSMKILFKKVRNNVSFPDILQNNGL